MFQVSDYAGDLLETPFYFRGICDHSTRAGRMELSLARVY
jgi:hypothetical protein